MQTERKERKRGGEREEEGSVAREKASSTVILGFPCLRLVRPVLIGQRELSQPVKSGDVITGDSHSANRDTRDDDSRFSHLVKVVYG